MTDQAAPFSYDPDKIEGQLREALGIPDEVEVNLTMLDLSAPAESPVHLDCLLEQTAVARGHVLMPDEKFDAYMQAAPQAARDAFEADLTALIAFAFGWGAMPETLSILQECTPEDALNWTTTRIVELMIQVSDLSPAEFAERLAAYEAEHGE